MFIKYKTVIEYTSIVVVPSNILKKYNNLLFEKYKIICNLQFTDLERVDKIHPSQQYHHYK